MKEKKKTGHREKRKAVCNYARGMRTGKKKAEWEWCYLETACAWGGSREATKKRRRNARI